MKKRNKYETIAFMHSGKPTLLEVNPKIIEMHINIDFSKNFEYSHEPYVLTLKPTDQIICTPDCINNSCTKGFFDLTNEINMLLRDQKTFLASDLKCDGWQDSERKGNNKCLAVLTFEITAKYQD